MNEDLVQPGEWVTSIDLDPHVQRIFKLNPNTRYQVYAAEMKTASTRNGANLEEYWLQLVDQKLPFDAWYPSWWFVREDEFVRKLREVL